jgi:hypothetical protein
MTRLNVYRAHGRGDARFLVKALGAKPEVRAAAHECLLWLDEETAAPALLEAVEKRPKTARGKRAAIILGQKGVKEAVPVILAEFSKLGTMKGTWQTTGVANTKTGAEALLAREGPKLEEALGHKNVEYERPRHGEGCKAKTSRRAVGGKSQAEASCPVAIPLEIHVAGYALWLLTGQELGANEKAWEDWWDGYQKSGASLDDLPGAFPAEAPEEDEEEEEE